MPRRLAFAALPRRDLSASSAMIFQHNREGGGTPQLEAETAVRGPDASTYDYAGRFFYARLSHLF